jgi:hypothetical protein
VTVHHCRYRAAGAVLIAVLASACTSSSGATGTQPEPTAPKATAVTTATGKSVGEATSTGNGVAFSYPDSWRSLRLSDSSASTGDQVWSRAFGIDGRNIVSVSAYDLGTSITDANIGARSESIREQLDSLFAQAGGALQTGPATEELDGLPALSFTGTAKNPTGRTVHSRLVLAFDGTTEYFVNCQYDDDAREEMLSGCRRVLATFSVRS